MPRFLTHLDARLIDDSSPPRWRLLSDLLYESDLIGIHTVPAGFETDFASVPRLPVLFFLAGDTCHKPAVLHDHLYHRRTPVSRSVADAVLREASAATRVAAWRRWSMWVFVRLGGAWHYEGSPREP